ncbi:MAG TPA: hypothetical protein VK166_04790 [Chitinophagaceae bacterium]|nr:hypothetical protein [Chitinophagaceae bacterium]
MKIFLAGILLLICIVSGAQSITTLTSFENSSIRGLSVVSDDIIWASGSNGMVALSTDGGKLWKWNQVKGFEKADFRDIEGFDHKTAVIMAVAEPAFILKTYNGGETWKVVYSDSTKGMFLDAMEFWDNGNGIVVGDPVDGKIYVARTADFGTTWHRYMSKSLPLTEEGEAMFASSGTNIRRLSNTEGIVVTGGKRSRLLIHEKWLDLPILQGAQSTGANSLAIWNAPPKKPRIVIVGGDFTRDTLTEKNCVYSTDLGKTWKYPDQPPHGYRSCVEFITGEKLISCGTSGVDRSDDGGKTWKLVSKESFHVCQKAKKGNAVYLAGTKGRIGRLDEDQ